MKISRLTLSALLLTTTAVLWSCSDLSPIAPPAPAPAPAVSPDLLGGLTSTLSSTVNTLLPCSPLPAATTTQTIGSGGGTIKVGPHRLVIPAGALSGPVTITATIKSEKVNRVHFEPSGLQFAKPANLTMSYANCGVSGLLPIHRIVYVSSNLQILQSLLSLDNLLTRSVSANIVHFSDYAVDDSSFSDHSDWW